MAKRKTMSDQAKNDLPLLAEWERRHVEAMAVIRTDGWKNLVSGIGDEAKDKSASTGIGYWSPLRELWLENAFAQDYLIRKICEKRPEKALARGFELSIKKDDGQLDVETSTAVQMACDALGAVAKFREGAIWRGLWGGAAIWVGLDDGQGGQDSTDSQARPVRPGSIRKVLFLEAMDRRWCRPDLSTIVTDAQSPLFGKPQFYELHPKDGGGGVPRRVHASRLIILDGLLATPMQRQRMQGWGLSVLDPVLDVVNRHVNSWAAAGVRVYDSQFDLLKIANLLELLDKGDAGQTALKNRMQAVNMARSSIHAMVIGRDEEFARSADNFTGMPEMLYAFMCDVAAASDMPVTVLFGRSPAGMNATGESDENMWHESVEGFQEHFLRPAIEQLVEYVLASKEGPTRGKVPKSWRVKFPALKQQTDKERAETRKIVAETDAIYMEAGVQTPVETAESRFRPEGWSMETQVDIDLHRKMAEGEGDEPEPGDGDDDEPKIAKKDGGQRVDFNPNQPRDPKGRFAGVGGASLADGVKSLKASGKAELKQAIDDRKKEASAEHAVEIETKKSSLAEDRKVITDEDELEGFDEDARDELSQLRRNQREELAEEVRDMREEHAENLSGEVDALEQHHQAMREIVDDPDLADDEKELGIAEAQKEYEQGRAARAAEREKRLLDDKLRRKVENQARRAFDVNAYIAAQMATGKW